MNESRFSVTRKTTERAQRLRREATPAERKLWARFKAKKLNGLAFRRQHPIGPYIVDFYCAALKLAIEIDGDSHGSEEALRRDEKRSAFIASKGVRIIRFWNSDIHERLDGALADILEEERIIRNEYGAKY
ncbi:MAG TPA: endonuclease domain-containing protein [Parvularculaceae bacterium]|nr:endonuclease domain-containing protein [Parvularculaceae bacterium]